MPVAGGDARPYTPEQLSVARRVCALQQDEYYEILAVDEQASEGEIKRAFKLLALQLHPDKNAAPGAEDAFKLVAEAYEVLGNAQKRAVYDNDRRGGFAAFQRGFNFPNDDEFEYDDDPPPFRPRTPAPNETRKQRRQREFEDRKARQRAQDHAERKARRREKERRRASKFRDMDDLLHFFADMGMRFVFCEHCDSIHLQMDDQPMEHDPPRRPEPRGRQPADADGGTRPRGAQQAHPAGDVPADEEVPRPRRGHPNARPESTSDAADPKQISLLAECFFIVVVIAGVLLLAYLLFKALQLVWAYLLVKALRIAWAVARLTWTTDVGWSILSLGLGLLAVLYGPVCFAVLRYGRKGVFVIRGASISRAGIRPVEFLTSDDIYHSFMNQLR